MRIKNKLMYHKHHDFFGLGFAIERYWIYRRPQHHIKILLAFWTWGIYFEDYEDDPNFDDQKLSKP